MNVTNHSVVLCNDTITSLQNMFLKKCLMILQMNLANPSPGPGRLYQFIEPPSNQRSCVDNVSQILQEEEKAYIRLFPYIITKFSCTFSNVFVCLFLCYFHRLS